MDLMPLFDVSVPRIYVIFDEFLDWVLKAFAFSLARHLQEEDRAALSAIADQFSYGSNGVFSGIKSAPSMELQFVSVRPSLLKCRTQATTTAEKVSLH